MCDKLGCVNVPSWHPVLLLYPPLGEFPIRVAINLKICDACKPGIELKDVMGDAGWEQLVKGVKATGKVPPARERTKLDWTSMDGREAEKMAEMKQRKFR